MGSQALAEGGQRDDDFQCEEPKLWYATKIYMILMYTANDATASQEPAFLRRLRGEASGQDPSRHQHAVARPRKPKNDDEDDGPTYVDENNNDVITKSEYEAMVNPETENRGTPERQEISQQSDGHVTKPAATATEDYREVPVSKEQVAQVGGSNKRRLAKVVGDEEAENDQSAPTEPTTTNKLKSRTKKGKKIKLSFDDEPERPE